MVTTSILRQQLEATLTHRFPSALTPRLRSIRPVMPTGIESVDELLGGGLPGGAITEVVGSQCSGRTSLALSFLARVTQAKKVCAWIDVSDEFDPESAAADGVDLSHLLWVRCGVDTVSQTDSPSQPDFSLPEKYFVPPPIKKGLHGGGFGSHPRHEAKNLSGAVSQLLQPGTPALDQSKVQHRTSTPGMSLGKSPPISSIGQRPNASPYSEPWSRIDQALRVADLLLQGGGFTAIVLDMGSIAPEYALRVPLMTWFRYRAAAERTQASILLLTQHPCAKSSAELLLRLKPGKVLHDGCTVFIGLEHCLEVARRRFAQDAAGVVPLRASIQNEPNASWCSRSTWAGPR
jgi:recombination protein RecA